MEDQSGKLLQQLIPDEWIVRSIPKDYGVDFEIELVDQTVVSGKRIWVQMKAVERTLVRTVSLGPENRHYEYVPFPLLTKEIRYALECPFPLLLFIADLSSHEIYWVPIRDEVLVNLSERTPKWHTQTSNYLRVPRWNRLSSERKSNYPGLRWFALEPARMYAFAMLHNLLHEFDSMIDLPESLVGVEFVDHGLRRRLRSCLPLARQYFTVALGIDVLFGKNGDAQFDWAVMGIEQAVHATDAAIALIKSQEYSDEKMGLLLGRINHGVNLLSTITNMYSSCSEPFMLDESSAVYWAIWNKRNKNRK